MDEDEKPENEQDEDNEEQKSGDQLDQGFKIEDSEIMLDEEEQEILKELKK